MPLFEDLAISSPVKRAVSRMGFEATTPIQESSIPIALEGKDIIGQAQTGTGKTAAFGIPMIERINKEDRLIKGLVVAPTRELSVQVAEELNSIGQFKGVRALPIYGGQDIGRQIKALKNKPQIIVGTPGRLMDHMRRRTIKLKDVSLVVLDEADEMLNMGFIDDIEMILKDVPSTRQTMLFSATMPRAIRDLAQKFMKTPELISIKAKEVTIPSIDQYYIELQERQKFDVLCRLLDMEFPELAIVFGRTRRRVDELQEALRKRGYSAEGIHGDLTQGKRDSVMRNFKRGVTEILVATDVAARGLDIDDITHIYNFDIPQDSESYVHRVGRTGRLGKRGQAVTFITSREFGHLKHIETTIKRRIIRQAIPSMSEALEGLQQVTVEKLMRVMEEEDISPYKKLAESMLQEKDSVSLLSAALKVLTREPDNTPVQLTSEAPMVKKGSRGYKGGSSGYSSRRKNYKAPRSKKRK